MLPIENFLQENWVEEGEKYLRVMESHPEKSRLPNAQCGHVPPKPMSAAVCCRPTAHYTHHYFNSEVYRGSKFGTPDQNAVTLQVRPQNLLTPAPPLREVKGMSQPSCVSSCDMSRYRRAGGRRREKNHFLYHLSRVMPKWFSLYSHLVFFFLFSGL